MTREIEPMNGPEERINRLKNPSLEDVRRFEIGKFLNYDERIKGSGEIKSIYEIKSLVHPKWFEEKETTNPEKWSVSQKVHDLIKNDKKAARRWRITKTWVAKNNSSTGKGHWVKKVRTPQKKHSKSIPYSKLTAEQKGAPGRKPGGMAYKIRREIWKLFSSPKLVLILLQNEDLSTIERGPIFKTGKSTGKSIPTPHLETALREMIERDIWPELGNHKMRIAKWWCNHRNVKRFLDAEERLLFMNGMLERDEESRIIHLICNKLWRVILTNWLELKIHSENFVKEAETVDSIYKKLNFTDDLEKGVYEKIIEQCDRCECLLWIREQDEKEIWCGTCGLVIGSIFSIEGEEEKRR